MVQIVLAEPRWQKKLIDANRRGLSALFWSHLNLYGRFELDMSKQLDLGPGPSAAGQQSDGVLRATNDLEVQPRRAPRAATRS
ncbi:hypothetical protein [Nonomuraea sp. NPDC002799]